MGILQKVKEFSGRQVEKGKVYVKDEFAQRRAENVARRDAYRKQRIASATRFGKKQAQQEYRQKFARIKSPKSYSIFGNANQQSKPVDILGNKKKGEKKELSSKDIFGY